MILEIEEDLRDFATIYKKDYPQKKAEKLTKYRSLIDCPPPFNILSGPYKQYLNTRLENQLLPHTEQSEDPEDNLNRVKMCIYIYIRVTNICYIIQLYVLFTSCKCIHR